jgi:hypothetical protein
MIDGDDKVEEPKELTVFDSLKEVEDYYRKNGQQVGFGVVKRSRKKGKDRRERHITLSCIRQGKTNKGKSDGTKVVSTIIITKYKAKICATLCTHRK